MSCAALHLPAHAPFGFASSHARLYQLCGAAGKWVATKVPAEHVRITHVRVSGNASTGGCLLGSFSFIDSGSHSSPRKRSAGGFVAITRPFFVTLVPRAALLLDVIDRVINKYVFLNWSAREGPTEVAHAV